MEMDAAQDTKQRNGLVMARQSNPRVTRAKQSKQLVLNNTKTRGTDSFPECKAFAATIELELRRGVGRNFDAALLHHGLLGRD